MDEPVDAVRHAGSNDGAYTQPDPHHSQGTSHTSVAHCPHDVLALIFEHVLDLTDRLRLAQVCQAWRECSLKTTSLWRDVRGFRHELSEDKKVANRQFFSLLSLCDERSRSTIMYADLLSIRSAETIKDSLDLLHRSKASLVGLAVAEHAICRCTLCRKQPAAGNGPPKEPMPHSHIDPNIDAAGQEVANSLFELLRGAASLDSLTLRFGFRHGLEFLRPPALDKSGKNVVVARPRELSLLGPIRCCAHPCDLLPSKLLKRERDILQLFESLASDVVRLVFDDLKFQDDFEWSRWAWLIFIRRSAHLESVRIPLGPLVHYRVFPKLKHASFSPLASMPHGATIIALIEYPPSEYEMKFRERPFWFSMPALVTMHSTPHLAVHIECPAVKVAYLHVTKRTDVDSLPKVLAAWAHLETLTIAFDFDEAPAGKGEEIFREVVELLTPSGSETKRRLTPKLRHLGFLRTVHPKWTGFWQEVPTWAAEPWSGRDISTWELNPYIDGRMPALPAQIVALALRRRGQQGKQAALETIKLGGVKIASELWRKLGQSCSGEVTCCPDALAQA